MVFNRKDLAKAFSPNKKKHNQKRRSSGINRPGTSGVSRPKTDSASQTSIKVIVRVRPSNERESQDNFKTVVKTIDDKMLVFDPKEEENPFYYRGVAQKGRDLLKRQNKELQFIFDRVFDEHRSNTDVFEGTTKDLIEGLLEGYNCSVFAYGATGAGKTHTMLGKDNDPGITYRTMAELFKLMEEQKDSKDFNLGVSYLEIYNENVQDLLHKIGPLHLREDGKAGVVVAGLKIISISNAEELLSLLAKGNKNRTQHATDANQESSRSHAVFQVYINIINKTDGQVKHVKLSMIDLAGSERASATGCKGARFKEGANINKSLLALGNCINNLADGIKHIPYRDSKLTRLLKDSLGGNCQTVMIANVSPSSATFDDTYNTLRYANRAKKIKTQVKKNIVSCEMHVSGYIKMVEELKKENETLKLKLKALEQKPALPSISSGPNNKFTEDKRKLTSKLIDLYDKKKLLNERVLSLESADKIMYCRILYKKAADERLCNLTAAVQAYSTEEQNASGKSRVHKSLQYFERQRDGIKLQLTSAWTELCQLESEITELHKEITCKNLQEEFKEQLNSLHAEIEKIRFQQQFEHAKKIIGLTQCETESMNRMIRMMSSTLQTYYNMMTGVGTITEKLKLEFKHLVKSLEGVRNIKWTDANMSKQEEDFYIITILSVENLDSPSNTNMPTLLEINPEDNEFQSTADVCTTDVCTREACTTPVTQTPGPSNGDILNTTITICDNAKQDQDVIPNTSETNDLNTTFCIPESKGFRKRVLSDSKNQEDSKSPVKAKKISPKQTSVSNPSIMQNGKENSKDNSKQPISDKSIKILNKLKTEKLKPITSPIVANETKDPALKIKVKDRRGTTTNSHPYIKNPVAKAKPLPAWQF